ncbi:hypothetical protein Agub_g3402, partial [Astrephomene gubernaculifera]
MHGLSLLRTSSAVSPYLVPGLPACAQLVERTAAAAAQQPNAAVRQHSSSATPTHAAEAAAAATTPATASYSSSTAAAAVGTTSGRCASGSNTSSSSSSSGGGKNHGNGRRGRHWRWNGWRAGAAGEGSSAASESAAAAAAAALGWAAWGTVIGSALADAGPSQSLRDALAAAQQSLAGSWGEVEEEMARINATLPARTPSLQGEAPRVSIVHDAVEVVVPVREGADTEAVLRELRKFGGRGMSTYSEYMSGVSRTVQLEVRPDPARPETAVRMQVFIPPPGGSEQ